MNKRRKEQMRDVKLIPVSFYGKQYHVPESLTVIQAYEFTGHRFTNGCGCRGGTCGACAALYIVPGTPSIRGGLACQTQVVSGMSVIQIPYFPTEKARYEIDEVSPDTTSIGEVYPKLYSCMGCNTCTKMCPQDIDVMECMSAALRGDIEDVAVQSLSCVLCGLCAARCPAEIAPYKIMLLGRRLYGRYLLSPSKNVPLRLKQIEDRQFDAELDKLMALDVEPLKEAYRQQQADKRTT